MEVKVPVPIVGGGIPIIGEKKEPGPYITLKVWKDGRLEYELANVPDDLPDTTQEMMPIFASVTIALDMIRAHTKGVLDLALRAQQRLAEDLKNAKVRGIH